MTGLLSGAKFIIYIQFDWLGWDHSRRHAKLILCIHSVVRFRLKIQKKNCCTVWYCLFFLFNYCVLKPQTWLKKLTTLISWQDTFHCEMLHWKASSTYFVTGIPLNTNLIMTAVMIYIRPTVSGQCQGGVFISNPSNRTTKCFI